jgi:hypothetical protein
MSQKGGPIADIHGDTVRVIAVRQELNHLDRASGVARRNRRNVGRGTKLTQARDATSAVTSYGLPDRVEARQHIIFASNGHRGALHDLESVTRSHSGFSPFEHFAIHTRGIAYQGMRMSTVRGGSTTMAREYYWTSATVARALVGVPAASNANSAAGTVDCKNPQSKQTASFGNTQTPGLSSSLSPPKCIIISAGNLA